MNKLLTLLITIISTNCFAYLPAQPINNIDFRELNISEAYKYEHAYEPTNGVIWTGYVENQNLISFKYQNEKRPIDIYIKDNKNYLAVVPGKDYEVKVCAGYQKEEFINNNIYRTNREMFILSVDGLNVISGKPADFNQSGYVLEKRPSTKSCMTIKGWRKSLNEVAKFTFTDTNLSYNAKTNNDQNNIGVIGIAVFDEKPEIIRREISRDITPFPRLELQSSNKMMHAAPKAMDTTSLYKEKSEQTVGTGHGSRIISKTKEVSFENNSSSPNELFIFEYKTYQELEKMGIIKKKIKIRNAFPGNKEMEFAPDPN